MKTLILTGGVIRDEFAIEFINSNSFDIIIGVDAGLKFLHQHLVMPTHIIGDFDSVDQESRDYFLKYVEEKAIDQIILNPQKDATDTEEAIKWAIKMESTEIVLIGATGRRIDHLLGNINLLTLAEESECSCYILDDYNKISLAKKIQKISKSEQFGKYVSFLPLTTEVTKVSLKGFKYPLNEATLYCTNTLGVSNELVEDYGEITFETGILIMIESRDTY